MSQSRRENADQQIGPLADILGYHFRRAWNVLRKDFEASVHDLGVRQAHIGILSVIRANPGINQGLAGRTLDIQRANMVALISELSDAGWVARGEDPGDRRAIALSLTPEGEKLLSKALERIEVHENRVFSVLSARERQSLLEMLQRLGESRPAGAE
ncbi:MarR family transcriptional regulator [Pelagerythrobacter marensis]|uniref:MarR family transcriptional regulator n=1 Tax=Pelagerythrobacter marensis TaxID=543877 RepID=A0ABZ2D8D9_9SPHN